VTIAARGAIVVLAGVVLAGFLHFLRADELRSQGEAQVRAAGTPPDARDVQRARDLFQRAGDRNPDPRPELDEATLLLSVGDDRAAAALLEDVVSRNAGSVRGWGLLAAATVNLDERRSLRANGELLKLYGRIPGPLAGGVIRSPGGRRYRVLPGQAKGRVDGIALRGDKVRVNGWAGLPATRRAVQEVLVVAHGRVVASTAPSFARPDVPGDYGGDRTGFIVEVQRSAVINDDGELDLHLFGAGLGAASLLPVDCRRPQPIGC
jgi:hypothetical protein